MTFNKTLTPILFLHVNTQSKAEVKERKRLNYLELNLNPQFPAYQAGALKESQRLKSNPSIQSNVTRPDNRCIYNFSM